MSGAPIPASPDALAALSGERRRVTTVSDYHRMVDAGILGEHDRAELIEGVILEVSPQSELHAQVIQRLAHVLYRSLPDEFAIRCQLPLRLGDRSEPAPDFAVLRAEDARSHREPPSRALFVVEVASESLRKDRDIKSNLYARFGIPEYWIVDLDARAIEVRRDPGPDGRYRTVSSVPTAGEATSAVLPGLQVRVSALFD
jgi:Uma2 family endonuclease